MSDEKKGFDVFELAAAILLGMGAIGASVAGHQGNLWGGQSVEAYGEAAALTTKASTTYNDELTVYMQDVQTDVRAKELIWEGLETEDETASQRQLGMASWLLTAQLSDSAYAHLGLPEETRKRYQEGDEEAVLVEEDFNKARRPTLARSTLMRCSPAAPRNSKRPTSASWKDATPITLAINSRWPRSS